MHAQIDQNIDLVVADFFDERFVRHPLHVVPGVGRVLQSRGDRIRPSDTGIAVDFERSAVVVFQQRDDEKALGLPIKVGRHITDFQAPVGVARICMRPDEFLQPIGVPLAPAGSFRRQRRQVVTGMKVHHVNQIAVRHRIARLQRDRLPIAFDRPVELTGMAIDVPQVADRGGEVGL